MKTVTLALAVVSICLGNTGLATSAESPAQLLEKGIYQEETEGNLDAAIKIYRQIVTDAKETQALAAEAQFRVGQCLLKQGKESEAVAAFQSLIEDFPNQKEIGAKAKKHLPDQLELLPAPWNDGERLTLTMKLAGGQKIGLVGLAVEAADVDGKPVWKMLARRYIVGGQNQGVSRVIVDQATNRPMSTAWDHTLLGTANAVFTEDKLTVTSQATPSKEAKTNSVDVGSPVFSNDQVFYVLRQLPLKIGYKTKIPIRVAFTGGNGLDLEVDVPAKETVETPQGSYECFRVETNINQTFWIADVPQRYLVKFDAQAVIAELTSIGDGTPQTYENSTLGFSLVVPNVELMALRHIDDQNNAEFQTIHDRLVDRLSDYENGLPPSQRLFLMKELTELVPDTDAFPALAGMELAAQFAAAHPLPARDAVLRRSQLSGGVWQIASPSGRAVLLFRTESINDTLLHTMAEHGFTENSEINVRLHAPGRVAEEPEFITFPAGPQLPGWRLSLVADNSSSFDSTVAQKNAVYLWTSFLVVLSTLLIALAIAGTFRRQIRIANLKCRHSIS